LPGLYKKKIVQLSRFSDLRYKLHANF